MSTLTPDYFFDLSSYKHAKVFDECDFVWEVVQKISDYLATLPLGSIETTIPSGVHLFNPELIHIGKNTIVEPGAYIQGPCWIGDDCTIRHGAYIRGNVITGNRCVIGHDTEIKNTLMLNGAQAAHFAYLGDSILGNDVNLGAGVKCANLNLDHGPVKIYVDGEIYHTHFRKLGAILGDRTKLGCNSVTNPGTLTGKGVLAYPCTNFGGFVSSDSVVQPSNKPTIRKRKQV